METVRRWYVYLVCAVTLQGVTWAAISLMRNLIIEGRRTSVADVALTVSVIVVALPLFLAHWLWAQRLASRDEEERASFPRLFYLYAMMTAFLVPLVNNAYQFLEALLQLLFGVRPEGTPWEPALSPGDSVWQNLVPVLILGLLWFYHRRVRAGDEAVLAPSEAQAIVRQIYTYLFTSIGLVMTAVAVFQLFAWLLAVIFPPRSGPVRASGLLAARELARLVAGSVVWLISWRQAQRLFAGGERVERESLVRKGYLYLVIFGAVMAVIGPVTAILADVFQKLLGVPTAGEDARPFLAVIVVGAVVWAYHAYVLRQDAAVAEGAEQQADVRRIYLYVTAGIGLLAVLSGLAGLLFGLFEGLTGPQGFDRGMREVLGASLAILLAGLPLWLINWWRIQLTVGQPEAAGQSERRAVVRRIYLYAFLFLATMTILGSAIYLLSQVLEVALGARADQGLAGDLALALSYALIATVVWLYHGNLVRREGRLARQEEAARMRPVKVAVVDIGDGRLGQAIIGRIRQTVPGVQVAAVGLGPEGSAAMSGRGPVEGEPEKAVEEVLGEAELIIGPWQMAVAGAAGGRVTAAMARCVNDSPATKLLVPVRGPGWEWTGVEGWKEESIVKEAAAAVKLMAEGEEVRVPRRMSPVLIAVIVLGVLCVLTWLVPSLIARIFMTGP